MPRMWNIYMAKYSKEKLKSWNLKVNGWILYLNEATQIQKYNIFSLTCGS